jgi:rubrerythrin
MTEKYSLWICENHGTFKTKASKAKCPICNSVKVRHIGYYNPEIKHIEGKK